MATPGYKRSSGPPGAQEACDEPTSNTVSSWL
jgi:hypothetical protein